MELRYATPWQLLVAVMLSAQCTDRKVNEITPSLFRRYPTVEDIAAADRPTLERMIYSSGFYRTKAKHLQEAAVMLMSEFGGQVPRTMREMLQIPGVARKTANVVLGNAYGVVEGIAVDTHVARLAQVLGLSTSSDPATIERDLMEVIPRSDWFRATYLLIAYGRAFCVARPHDHSRCPLGGTVRTGRSGRREERIGA
jgi:endonuclease-3